MGRRNENVCLPVGDCPWNLHFSISYHWLTLRIPWQGSLRDQTEQVDEYVIPRGDWFESVSSPHYLAEIVTLSLSLCAHACFHFLSILWYCEVLKITPIVSIFMVLIAFLIIICRLYTLVFWLLVEEQISQSGYFLDLWYNSFPILHFSWFFFSFAIVHFDPYLNTSVLFSSHWQVANLAFAAAETHRWYLRKFDNYPINRFAIIPFLYWAFDT